MIKELVIHLGDHKTGSTSIQDALANRGWNCSSTNILYPSQSNHNRLAKAIGNARDTRQLSSHPETLEAITRLQNQFKQSNADVGIISAESFEGVNPTDVQNFIAEFFPQYQNSLRLIAYVRPHAERLISSFSERIKMGEFDGTPADFHAMLVEKKTLFYAPRLRAWRQTFAEQVTFRPFMRSSLAQQDIVYDFFNFVVGEDEFSLDPQDIHNESLSVEDLIILLEVHRYLRNNYGDKIKRNAGRIGYQLAQALGALPRPSTKLRLHRQLVEDVITTYLEDASSVDQEFFSGQPLLSALEAQRNQVLDDEVSFDATDYYDSNSIRMIRCWANFICLTAGNSERHAPAVPLNSPTQKYSSRAINERFGLKS